MAWSYRSDRSDETYHEPGVALVEGEKIPHTPRDSVHAEQMIKGEKEKTPKDARVTEHQKYPGQNVPRIIGETEEQKKIREDEEKKEGRPLDGSSEQEGPTMEETMRLQRDRELIRYEEQQKATNEEREKEREKIRKEEAANVKKAEKSEHSHQAQPANKK